MFLGQPGVWPLPWEFLRARDHYSRLWNHHPGQADRKAREPAREDKSPQEDHLHPDHDRPQAGLCHRGEHTDRWWRIQRRYWTVARTTPRNARWTISVSPCLAGIRERFGGVWRGFRLWVFPCAWVLALLLLIPLKDTRPSRAQAAYDHASKLLEHGRLIDSQQEAEEGYRQYRVSNPEWAIKFQLLEAESMVLRGMYSDALRLLAGYHPDSDYPEEIIRKLAIEADALTRQQQLSVANQKLTQAEDLCKSAGYASCGYVLREQGILAVMQGHIPEANLLLIRSLSYAQSHQDRYLEAAASVTLGWAALQSDHFDEAVDWSKTARRAAEVIGAEGIAQVASGNLGWAYYQLGDDERALELFLEAEKSAARLGDIRNELKWISTAGYVYHDTGDSTRATQSYRQALYLARQIDSKEDVVTALEDLAEVSVETGKLEEASAYIDQVTPMESEGSIRLSTNVMLTQGMLAAARRQDRQAETLFREVQSNPANPTSSRL